MKKLLLLPLALLSATYSLAQVRVTVGHFAPFANTVDGTSVTIRVNGNAVLNNVKFGDFTEYLSLGPAGTYKIEVLPSGTSTVAITQDIPLVAGDYSVYAVGGANSQALSLLALTDNNTAPASGKAKIRVVHAAPFAATEAATAVSIRDQTNAVVGGLGSVPFKTASGYLEVNAGRIDLAVANPGGTQTFIDLKPISLAAGSITTVIATGGGNTLPLGITGIAAGASPRNSLPQFTLGPVQVRAVHAAPFAATLPATAVNIKVNGSEVAAGVQYKQFSGVLNLPSQGSYLFEVTPVGASAPAISQFVDLDGGSRQYNVAAVGDGVKQPLSLLSTEQDIVAPANGRYKLQVVHAAPFANTIDGTRVSIRTDGGAVVAGLANVPFKGASGTLDLPVGALDIKVASVDGLTNFIDPAPINAPSGASVVAYAIGDGVNQPLSILAVPLGELALEKVVDFSVGGHWIDPAKQAQGIDFLPIPSENRLVGTWYTYNVEGTQPRWFIMDTCRNAVGAPGCTNGGAFDGATATMALYDAVGGRFNAASSATARQVGTFTVTFTNCKAATASFTLNDGTTGTMALGAIIAGAGCR
jgi:Domain of unknown function (DUF4397)